MILMELLIGVRDVDEKMIGLSVDSGGWFVWTLDLVTYEDSFVSSRHRNYRTKVVTS